MTSSLSSNHLSKVKKQHYNNRNVGNRAQSAVVGNKEKMAKIYVVAVPLVLAILYHYFSQKPPLDFGTGSMFDNIAKNYDFINRALSLNMDRGWRKVMIDEITSGGLLYKKDNHQWKKIKILDLATGTADVAILLAESYKQIPNVDKATLEVTGVDPSKNMLACKSSSYTYTISYLCIFFFMKSVLFVHMQWEKKRYRIDI